MIPLPKDVREELIAVREAAKKFDEELLGLSPPGWTYEKELAMSKLCEAIVVALRRL